MKRKYYEIEFAIEEELNNDNLINTPDRYSVCIIAEHEPTEEEVKIFCKDDMNNLGYDAICSITEIDYDEAHEFYAMENEDILPILK